MNRIPPLACALLFGCGAAPPAKTPSVAPAVARADEPHLANLRQLTFGGENAEAYWSQDGTQLVYQARRGDLDCDRIYRMALADAKPIPVSSGLGATTCSFFLPGDREVIFASTHLGGAACPPKPDRSHGYVWALYDTYDIYRANLDGSNLRRLTETKGYDAEGTVCPKDGSIIFTSVRDGDIDLYRMDADGKNVKRLTDAPGYDGGAFFSADCTKIVWRASRPRGAELDEYRKLLARGLVRPTKLELYVANADGSEPTQVTYLNAASFAPNFFPSGKRILFSSNHGDPRGREFDLWAINTDGTRLERITRAPGFDGFPMFSPGGKRLAFSSNRATAPGRHDTNVFVADWIDTPPNTEIRPADRIAADVAWLADPAREGRGIGTAGLAAARDYIAHRFGELGLAPAGDSGFLQEFPVTTAVKVDSARLRLGGSEVSQNAISPLGFSASGEVKARAVLAGYGIHSPADSIDDYDKVVVRGAIAVVRRFVPDSPSLSTDAARRLGDLRQKAFWAREQGAKALIVVDWPAGKMVDEARPPALEPEGYGDAGIPVVVVTREAIKPVMAQLEAGKPIEATLQVSLTPSRENAQNVVGLLKAGAPDQSREVVVIGAHYDHLGYGGRYSLAPGRREPHLGADDNASGVATMLEIARALSARRSQLKRDVLFVAFSGEEAGVLGSTWLVAHLPKRLTTTKEVTAMLNLDMVGRMRGNRLSVLGADSAAEWQEIARAACDGAGVECGASGDGYGPSDQTPFYAAGVPVLFFFTGAHSDYHKPSDSAERINAAGAAQVAQVASAITEAVAAHSPLTYRASPSPPARGDQRSFNASLGTVPDYAGPPGGRKGVLLAGVRPGGAAERAGMRRGDILIRLGASEVATVEDLMFILDSSKPGETVTATVIRDGAELKLQATFQEGRKH